MNQYLYIALVILCVDLLTTNTNALPGDLVEPHDKPYIEQYQSEKLDFLTFGDWGWEGIEPGQIYKNQSKVAMAMRDWAESYDSDFIINTGDNFYISYDEDHEGVKSVNDPKWNRIWNGIYKGRLAEIVWYSVVGNHDWYGNVTAQVDYSLNYDERFFLPSTYYVRESYFGSKITKVAWIHIDTNIFYYEPLDPDKVNMLPQLKRFGWNTIKAIEDKLKWIEDRLIEQQNSTWIFVVGHHPLVAACAKKYYMGRLRLLFEKYRVDAYFAGHEHNLAIETAKDGQPVTYFLSGAGSKTFVGCNESDWGTPVGTLGFLHTILTEDKFTYEFIDSTTALDPKIVYTGSLTPRP
ncbi:uncharacterized protein OCT59_013546 [Rhizophagus irregularis]|uniref:Metallo-dependent phosphatase-like protein n=3 Tax=Rhizophagus irregularis TaxID=588596 RepID=U9SW72_RHIID|nr:Metallo-dependent phosphatase-like protein [Rhizophagus irregularis DAOM 181602=DAOM 197198]EXX59272.1 hypothetical protein RirG_190450 [Rhizophagus irregularis DAOM 197198w]UZO21145.1 hypothetical protein OCT59_013546 [Rhizophagus irregularis]POG82895.1 Metallo-dependent phosphatase-like protein [Rhizophagus irregularis DAOM 181602=DAOM 197198]CAG8439870.1 16468_t:CDS:2 [Rhizophagus irregularis]GBC45657.1 acid phosphatase [Rhizophagus irregularis DAOM 181602=DAOM 197198]|eukprot:XP_025189761.1 Metallo-dependent phosphatase-like protein [Rhizophagus irregularis DAOM 181602=DAOM 197198]